MLGTQQKAGSRRGGLVLGLGLLLWAAGWRPRSLLCTSGVSVSEGAGAARGQGGVHAARLHQREVSGLEAAAGAAG
eukprot:scaffold49013_cov53-Phaeocystis_antarctica.AAC.3